MVKRGLRGQRQQTGKAGWHERSLMAAVGEKDGQQEKKKSRTKEEKELRRQEKKKLRGNLPRRTTSGRIKMDLERNCVGQSLV